MLAAALVPLGAVGCGSWIVERATISDRFPVPKRETVAARLGETESLLLLRAGLVAVRDDLQSTVIERVNDADRAVLVTRSVGGTEDRPVIVCVVAAVHDGDAPEQDARWVRYERVVGSGKISVERGEGSLLVDASTPRVEISRFGRLWVPEWLDLAVAVQPAPQDPPSTPASAPSAP